MELSKVVNISGKPGLYQIVAQSANRIIVESLDTGKRSPVFARDNFSILADISIFTYEDNIALEEVLVKIYEIEGGKPTIDPSESSVQDMKDKMKEAVPNYDEDNVYASDMKKLFKWYNMLVTKKLWSPEDVHNSEEEKESNEDKPKKKAAKKTATPKASAKPAAKTKTKTPKAKSQSKGKVKK